MYVCLGEFRAIMNFTFPSVVEIFIFDVFSDSSFQRNNNERMLHFAKCEKQDH